MLKVTSQPAIIFLGIALFSLFVLEPASCSSQKQGRKEAMNSFLRSHPNTHIINLNARQIYLGLCSEEAYDDWYYNQYPLQCQMLFSNASDLHDLFNIYCDPFCGDLYFDYMYECGTMGALIADYYIHLCLENEQGVPCFHYMTLEEHIESKEDVEDICLPYNGSCTYDCYEKLDYFAETFGCCVNTLYNQSRSQDEITNYEMWESCRVNTPDECRSELTSGGNERIMKRGWILLSILIIVLVSATIA